MAHLHALPTGHELEGYRIERVLGAGGFGITYKAIEAMIGRAVAIKEYLPSSVAARAVDSLTVHPLVEADSEVFRWGLKRFRNEARTLVSFRHPNIVPVYRYFEANGTAYLVMAYEDGISLGEILKKARTLSEAEILEFLYPLLSGVAEVHKAGFLHRDQAREHRHPPRRQSGADRFRRGAPGARRQVAKHARDRLARLRAVRAIFQHRCAR